MAKSRNFLVAQALRDHHWVLWIDVDVDDYPPESLKEMMNIRKDIVVPNCVMPDGNTYDRNTYKGGDEASINKYFAPGEIVYNGYYPIAGRVFGVEMKEEGDIVEVDGVGGVLLLVRGDVHRSGAFFPTFNYKRTIETEGFAKVAKDIGFKSYILTNLSVLHK